MKISAVLFDLDHALCLDHQLEESILKRLIAAHGGPALSHEPLLAILNGFRMKHLPLQKALEKAFQALRLQPSENLIREFKSACLAQAEKFVTPLPGVSEMLAALAKRHMPTAIFSNGWAELQQRKAVLIGFTGAVITADTIHAWKPDPDAFLLAAARLNFKPSETLYVGDSPKTDVAGAKSAGMLAAWFNPERKPFPQLSVTPDFTIHALPELRSLIVR